MVSREMAKVQLSIPEKIVIVRRRLGETQEKFGERFRVRKLTVNQWETDVATPKHEHLTILNGLFQRILGEEDESKIETAAYQLLLPFDQPVNIDLRMSPNTAETLRVAVEIRRKVV